MPMRTAIGLDDLRAFFLISEAGGVSAAARRFGLSKATLSRALARLEDRAGGPLFDRISSGLKLTAAGDILLDAARQATEAGSAADEVLRTVTEEPKGTLRIAASALSGQYLLGPVVARMAQNHPKVTTHIEVTASGPDPLAEDLDLVLRLGRPDVPYLIARRITNTPMKLYCGVSFAHSNTITDIDEVRNMPRVCIDVPGAPVNWHLTGPNQEGLRLEADPVVYAGDPTVALGLVQAGAGITMLPALFGDAQVKHGGAVPVLPDYDMGLIEIFAVFPPRRSSVPAVRIFIDYLIEYAQGLEFAG